MSSGATDYLARPRSVRFSDRADRLLAKLAASAGKTVSEIVRERVEPGLEDQQTAAEALLSVAARPAKLRPDPASRAFRKAWRERHQP